MHLCLVDNTLVRIGLKLFCALQCYLRDAFLSCNHMRQASMTFCMIILFRDVPHRNMVYHESSGFVRCLKDAF